MNDNIYIYIWFILVITSIWLGLELVGRAVVFDRNLTDTRIKDCQNYGGSYEDCYKLITGRK